MPKKFRKDVSEYGAMLGKEPQMRDNSNLMVMILLNIVGVMLVMGAVLLVLKGMGWVNQLPNYVTGALLLLALGIGILGGIRTAR